MNDRHRINYALTHLNEARDHLQGAATYGRPAGNAALKAKIHMDKARDWLNMVGEPSEDGQ